MKLVSVVYLLQILALGCVLCDHCGDTTTADIVSTSDNADVILKGRLIEQSSCDADGEYSEAQILQECIYGTDSSSMFASTTAGVTPKHLVRGLRLCELEEDVSYMFFLNLEPSPLFSEALQCGSQTIENGMILYANDTSLIIPVNEESKDEMEQDILRVTNSKSCASVSSSNEVVQPSFQGFCKCSTQDSVTQVVVVDVQTSNPASSVVIDRVTDVVTEQALVFDQDRQVSFDDGADDNGVLSNSVGIFGSAVCATLALLAFGF